MNIRQRVALATGMLLLLGYPCFGADTNTMQPATAAATILWDSGPYTYDGSGNIAVIASPATDLRSSFRYDRLNRLVGSTIGTAVETFTYDPFGNLIASERTGLNARPISSPADLNNHLSDPASPTRFKYDAAGNLIIESYGETTYGYDALNMMTSKQWTGSSETYIYTPSDERIGVRVGGTGTDWRWTLRDESGKELREYQQSSDDPATPWTWVEDHVYRGGVIVGAQRQPDKGGQLEFHLDHLGTPRLITNLQGSIVSRSIYSPFGIEYTDIGQMRRAGADREEPLKFTGHHRDFMGPELVQNELYLDYMHARYYEPVWGRFLSVDPDDATPDVTKPQSWNRYTYALNSPSKYVDPDGKSATIAGAVLGGVVGGGLALFRGASWREVGAAAAGGAVTGAMMGSVIDTGGASLPVLLAAGGLSGAAGAMTENLILGRPHTVGNVAPAAIGGTAGVMLSMSIGPAIEAIAARMGGFSNTQIAQMTGMLQEAAQGKGNFGIGEGSAREADAMGKAWVGSNYKVASDGKTLVSGDGLRQYRPPAFKPNLQKVQANFEWRIKTEGQWQGNGHLDVN